MTARIVSIIAATLVLPAFVTAHETHVYDVGGTHYQFVIGSLNEPLTVDDKTGVDLRIAKLGDADAHADHDHSAGDPLSGLESSLKVELIAGESRRILDLSPQYGVPGGYKAPFYPTVATTLSYRVFCELEGEKVDLTFTCSQRGHTAAEESDEEVEVSPGVTRVSKTGSYGCPVPKADAGFPEPSTDLVTLTALAGTPKDGMIAYGALVVAFLAMLLAWRRR